MKVNYSIKSAPSTPSTTRLILVHGGPGMDDSYFFPYLDSLVGICDIWHYTQSTEDSADMPLLVKELKTVIDSSENYKSTIILGHSFGGALVLEYIKQHGIKDISKLILMGPVYDTEWTELFANENKEFLKSYEAKTQEEEEYYSQLDSNTQLKQSTIDYAPLYFHQDSIEEGKKVLNKVKYYGRINNDLFSGYLSQFDLKDVIKEELPTTMVIAGETDKVVLSSYQKRVCQFNPNIFYKEVDNAGHFPFIDGNEQTINLINDFIKG